MHSPLANLRVGWLSASRSESVASFRLRSRKPVELLRAAGVDAKLIDLEASPDCDVVVFQKVYDIPHLEMADRVRSAGKAVLFDLCDNHFFNPHGSQSVADRAVLLARMIEVAHTVSVSTDYLGSTLQTPSMVVPDCLENVPVGAARLRATRCKRRRDRSLRVVWSGNAGDAAAGWGVIALEQLFAPLTELRRDWDVHLTVVTNNMPLARTALAEIESVTSVVRWRRQTEWIHYSWADACVLPIIPNDFSLSKTANRVATSLGRGMPVVASHHPAYDDFEGSALFEDWVHSIERYRTDADLVERHIRTGNEIAERIFGDDSVREAWVRAIQSALAAA